MGRDLHDAAKSAIGSARLEGGEIDDDTATLIDHVACGELTGDEAVSIALARHGLHVPA